MKLRITVYLRARENFFATLQQRPVLLESRIRRGGDCCAGGAHVFVKASDHLFVALEHRRAIRLAAGRLEVP